MIGYIYLTTNLLNGKKYIGQHKHSSFDTKYIGSGILLTKAINKYGKENFKCEILQECYTIDELNFAEKEWIAFYNANNLDEFYNVAKGGLGHTCSPWNKGKSQPLHPNSAKGLEYGRHLPASDKLKSILRDRKNRVIYTDEYRKKLSNQQKDRKAINNGIINTYVKSCDLEKYLKNGWALGLNKNISKNKS